MVKEMIINANKRFSILFHIQNTSKYIYIYMCFLFIISVTANDEDLNSNLSFWVSEPLFRVVSLSVNQGQLQVNR